MAYQESSQGWIARLVQSGLGTQAAAGGASKILRSAGGQGGRLSKASIESNEVRRDYMRTRGRHGTQKTAGSYEAELSIGALDDIIEAVFRGTWSAADLAITEATAGLTSITTGANTIVASAGSWITAGMRVGDVVRLTGHSSAGNNGRNLRVTGVTALTLTIAETLTVDAVADTAFTLTRTGRKLINPAAGAAVKRYFTVEEYEINIDGTEVFTDAVWNSLRFQMQPNGIIMASPSWVGTGQFQTLTTGAAPYFTAPTETTAVPLSALDATVRLGSGDLVDLTSFDLTIDIGGNAPDVAASRYAPDVFTGQMGISGSITVLRKDLLKVADFIAETPTTIQLLAVEPETEPKDFFSLFLPNFTLGSVDKSALSKEAGPRTETISIPQALVGKDQTGGAFEPAMCIVQVSNAT